MADTQPPDGQINGGGPTPLVVSSETVGSKRQRRPSVRLGDIGGDQPYDSSYTRRANKPWKYSLDNRKDTGASGKSSKTRPLMNLSAGGAEFQGTLEGEDKENNLDSVAIGSWRLKDSKRRGSAATKRVRSNWVSCNKNDEGGGGGGEGEEKYSGGEDIEDGYDDVENSESPLKEQSPMHSLENLGMEGQGNEREMLYQGNRRSVRSRVSEGREQQEGLDFSGPSDTDARNWKCGDRIGIGIGIGIGIEGCGEDGVRIWLNGLGLGRYAPVFEIHEVDDEVLPMLTLEDLKDMGINAVGSRRKMYCAIQKLGKGFS